MSEKGTSVLASLTASVMQDKKAEARKLTPVEGEAGAIGAGMPNDVGVFMSNEALHSHAKELRRFAADAIAIADGLDAMLAGTYLGDSKGEAKADPAEAQKEKEREADARVAAAVEAGDPSVASFKEAFEKKQREAQAAVFQHAAADEADEPEATDEWRCPVHDVPGTTKTSSKTGREFIGCPQCNAFKR